MNIDEYLDVDELVDIVNDTLSKNEQMKIFNKVEFSTQCSQENFIDIEDDYDNINETKEEEYVDCLNLAVIS